MIKKEEGGGDWRPVWQLWFSEGRLGLDPRVVENEDPDPLSPPTTNT